MAFTLSETSELQSLDTTNVSVVPDKRADAGKPEYRSQLDSLLLLPGREILQ